MKKVTYRAECFSDIIRFQHLLEYHHNDNLPWTYPTIEKFTYLNLGQLEGMIVTIEFENDTPIEYFKNIAANINDAHVIEQTLNFGDNPRNRDRHSFRQEGDFHQVTTPVSVDDCLPIKNN